MIQAIKIPVVLKGIDDGELSFDYEEDGNTLSIYLGEDFICSLDYDGNFKQEFKILIFTSYAFFNFFYFFVF
ncbi:hypothetical protein LCGC14_3020820 [marine sediment metagenome]|uniref:Uncharacterized protein n=1 Tax=marine sediment metagenome TaxID=412755 RepID=A0A0F8WVV0_9ZZZZ